MAALAKTWMLSVLMKASNTSKTGAWDLPGGEEGREEEEEGR